MSGATTRGLLFATATALSSCSLVTPFGGLSGAPEDAGALASDAEPPRQDAGDASADADAGPKKPRAWRQVTVTSPPPRHSARMAFDSTRNRAVLFGGVPPNAATLNETWEWDGATWSRPTLTASPTSRRSPGLVFDSARRVVMVFAGSEATPLSEPWEWDGGSTWRSSGVTSMRPSIRNGAAMAYDPQRNVVVVFGGQDPLTDKPTGETWEWSATGGFVKRSPPTSPPARRGHVMVYDEGRKRVAVFAGYNGSSGGMLADLWEWDGTTWLQRTAALAPPPRTAACAAYDSARHVLVVFGGRDDPEAALDDTWEWNGESWRQGPTGPPARRSCGITYDAARDAVVMYGGSPHRIGTTQAALGDTWLYE